MSDINDFINVGRDLFAAGLNNSHSGNLSVRRGENMLITRTGSMLHRLEESDIIKTSIAKDDDFSRLASREIAIHRAIYANTSANAVVHAHVPCLIALTMGNCQRFMPTDAEGLYYFKKGVFVLKVKKPIASAEAAELIPPLLKDSKAVIIQSHGAFTIGATLNEAYHWLSSLEHSAKIALIQRLLPNKDLLLN